jgi:hypothetical protein
MSLCVDDYFKYMEVLVISVKVQCMGDKYEDSYECLFRIVEISCMFLYRTWIILALYIFVLYMNCIHSFIHSFI